MRIVLAPDSFKECATASEICRAMDDGLRRVFPQAEIVAMPMADGGEGTVEALVAATDGNTFSVDVKGPLQEPVRAEYGFLGDGETAVIEMAAASGLPLVPVEQRDPGIACTHGTGELLRDALDKGARRIIVGLGGSATNDVGVGFARALGYRFLDAHGTELAPGGLALEHLTAIDSSQRDERLDDIEIIGAYDVAIPLCGPNGASKTYAYQKGADEPLASRLENSVQHFSSMLGELMDVRIADIPGAGAAGGFGAGIVAFAGGQLRPGFEVVAEAIGLEREVQRCDLVLTGEGSLDGQSVEGKTPVGVARIARRHNVPVVAFAGKLGEGYRALHREGIDAMFSLCSGPMETQYAIENYVVLLTDAVEDFARTWSAARSAISQQASEP